MIMITNQKINMRSYHIEIIHERGSATCLEDREIRAESMTYSDSGCYVFWLNEKPFAYYPISRTIINSIEYHE